MITMRISAFLAACACVISLMLTCVSSQSWATARISPGWFYRETGHYDDINESTVLDRVLCTWRCFQHVDCVGVSYNNTDNSCLLITVRKLIFRQLPDDSVTTELTLIRPINVCEAKSSNKEYAYASVNEAREACSMIGLKLMTYAELDSARVELSYTSCRCGYVDEGDTYIPMATMECYSGTIGMNNCSLPMANAYCKSLL